MFDDMTMPIHFACFAVLTAAIAFGQDQTASSEPAEFGTSNDLFVMFGSDVVRPSLAPKANYNIGLGQASQTSIAPVTPSISIVLR